MDLLHNALNKSRFYPAVISEQQIISYNQLERYVEATGEKLHLKPLTCVAISAPVSLKYIVLLIALWREKIITCSLDPKLPAKARNTHLKQLGCKELFRSEDIESLVSLHNSAKRFPNRSLSPDQNLTLTFTSGSSGTPKAVLHTYANHYFSALGSNKNIPVNPGDRWLLNLPLYHVSGLSILFRTFLAGGAVVIPSDKDMVKQIQCWNVTHLSIVPTQLQNIKKRTSLKAVLVGGAPIPQGLAKRSLKKFPPLYLTYGLTETASQIATTVKAGLKAKVLPYRTVKISANGEIFVKGKILFKGYWKNGKIIKATDKNGWFATGDVGSLNRGQLIVSGRKDNMFISGGENIHPEEIEKQLLNIPGVEKAVVISINDKRYGQRPIAFVKTRLSAPAITKYLRRSLVNFKIPDKFYPWPKNIPDRLKISRKIFQELAESRL